MEVSSECFLSSFNYRVHYKRAFSADLLVSGTPPPAFFAGSEHSELTAAVAKSSLGTYQMTSGGLGVPRPTCTLFSGDRSSISEEAWEEMKQNKCPVRKS